MLTFEDIKLLKEMVQGRINAVRANKGLDSGERARLVAEYEMVLHKLGSPRLLALIQHASV